MALFNLFMAAFAALVLTALAIHWSRPWFAALGAVDHPNARSSHRGRVPNAGGLVILSVTVPLWALTGTLPPLAVFAGLLLLAVVSAVDDWRTLGVWTRLGAQSVAVVLGMATLIDAGAIPTDGPLGVLWVALLGIGWMWFINAFNFMDGADGLAGVETVTVVLGLALLGLAASGTIAVLIGAVLGFLVWNWRPAKIFLGDGGSVPLGFLLGYWLVAGVNGPHWAAAMILPAYFCWDASMTVFHRWRRGEKLTEGHRRHAYQQAIDRVGDHAVVARSVFTVNVGLLVLALLSPGREALCLALATALVFGLVSWMKRGHPLAWLPPSAGR